MSSQPASRGPLPPPAVGVQAGRHAEAERRRNTPTRPDDPSGWEGLMRIEAFLATGTLAALLTACAGSDGPMGATPTPTPTPPPPAPTARYSVTFEATWDRSTHPGD